MELSSVFEEKKLGRRKDKITLSIEPWQKQELERIAAECGCLWGGKPNVSELLRAIAEGQVRVQKNQRFVRNVADKVADLLVRVEELEGKD